MNKLRTIRNLQLPNDLFKDIPPKVLKKYRQRVSTEDLRELRRHPDPIRYTLLSAFFLLRSLEITDNLADLFNLAQAAINYLEGIKSAKKKA